MRDVDPLDLVETIREGVLVLKPDLTIRFANRSFCHMFAVAPEHTVGRKLYEIGNGEWDIPKLRTLLETIISGRKTIEAFEVEHFFPSIGQRIMVLNARTVYRPGNKIQQILLAIDDVTERVRLEREHAAAHERIGVLLQELTHRVKNSLQFIASMVTKAGAGGASPDGRRRRSRIGSSASRFRARRPQKEQPPAIPFAPGIEMPSPNPERSTVPSTSDVERPVPYARGKLAGRPEG